MQHDFSSISDEDWPELASALQGGFATALNVYRTMAHHPDLLNAWAPLRGHVVTAPALTLQQSEIVILRTGHRLGSAYEWAHHIHRARKVGIDDIRIARIAGPLPDISGDDATIARAVDELFDQHRLTDETRARLGDLVGPKGILDVMATVGFYSVLGFIVNSFDTLLDDDVAREMSEWPLSLGDDQGKGDQP